MKKSADTDISKREFLRRCFAVSAGLAGCPFAIFSVTNIPGSMNEKVPAMFQEVTPRGIMCRICPNECVLKEGELSQCKNRIVEKSKLYTLAFGNPCSVNIDPVEKKPLYHFFPGSSAYSIATAGCNLACMNCQNWTISQTSPDKTRNYDMMPSRVVNDALRSGSRSIAYTYSEPVTFYEYTYETALLARKEGVRNIVKSNGYINPEPLKKLCTVIDAANIDLKSFNESTYLRLTGGKLQPVLDSIKIYKESGVWLELTHLIIPGWTDKPDEITAMCKWLINNGFADTPIHFSRFHPTYKLDQLPPTPLSILDKAAEIAKAEGLMYVYTGNVPGSEQADTRCPGCGSILIKRQGYKILTNTLKDGSCFNCGRKIEGVWKLEDHNERN